MKKNISLFIIVFIITGFSIYKNQSINYDYIEVVDIKILSTLKEMKNLNVYEKIENFEKTLYVEIRNDGANTKMIFNSLELVGKEMKNFIKKSNRFLIVSDLKIPIIVSSDTSLHNLKEQGVKLITRGYLIEFDIDGNIILEGLIQ
jgi:hypothetical protein